MDLQELIGTYTQDQLEKQAQAQFQPNPGLAFGPYLIGYGADGFAYGLLALQFLQWYTMSYQTERTSIKLLVWWTFLGCTAYTALTARWMLNLFAYGFDVYVNFYNFEWISTLLFTGGLVLIPVTGFFAHRAYTLLGNPRWFGWMICPILLISFGNCLALRIKAPVIVSGPLLKDQPAFTAILVSWLSIVVITDLIVTGTICWALLKRRVTGKGFAKTDRVIKKFIVISIQAQLFPTLFSLGVMIGFLTVRRWNFTVMLMSTPKVYAIALLGILNARHYLHNDLIAQKDTQPDQTGLPQQSSSHKTTLTDRLRAQASRRTLDRFQTPNSIQAEIHVQTETIQETYRLQPFLFKKSINRTPSAIFADPEASSFEMTPEEELGEIVLGESKEQEVQTKVLDQRSRNQ
ncbi:uncharacterized protein L201_005192 [Kwoniella dendrophila CBS 6074]|uniref:DUF6534 domain-containing protein n=1 Tax=Kwoniella dendrophila CBS 6074 TaxID=1295534 RepID=A0AAX4JZG0_9TREE